MIHHLIQLHSDQLENLPRDLTWFIYPLGGMEQHGAHLPLGTQAVFAEKQVALLIEKLNALLPQHHFVQMPLMPWMVDGYTSKIAFTVRAHVLRDALVDQCEALYRLGFSQFAAYTLHKTPRTLTAIEDAGKIICRRRWGKLFNPATFISISSNDIRSDQVLKSPMIALPSEHGGATDSGLMLHWHPSWVDLNAEATAKQNPVAPSSSVFRFFSYFKNQLDGTWGNLNSVDPKISFQNLNQQLDRQALLLKTFIETEQGKGLFISAYRYFPFNGSFFKAYLMAGLFFILMLVWTLWTLRDVFDA
jgi:creatinine amidohydrolase/Fe(II)-dependent formamide hydrolase-like protein